MKFGFKAIATDKKSNARAGVITTPNGKIMTPAFTPVATKASVKTLDIADIKKTNSQVILANTYHLYLHPGTETLKKFKGFAPFMGWDGPTITDSGGYQVSFLWSGGENADRALKVKITDKGAIFRSHIDGSKHLLTPQKSMAIQKVLGADIIMAFDQPLSPRYSDKKNSEAFKRTLLWEGVSYKAWQKQERNRKDGSFQALYGIVQGGTNAKLRRESLKFILDTGFVGIAIGGESVGSDPKVTSAALDTIVDILPEHLPVHALGLGGGPEGIIAAVARGIDTFDNTSITRMARTGLVFVHPTDGGTPKNKFRINIKAKKYKSIENPISSACSCYTCKNYSAAYIHHLQTSREITGLRLATIHNITYVNKLMTDIRESIINNNFTKLKENWFCFI